MKLGLKGVSKAEIEKEKEVEGGKKKSYSRLGEK